MEEIKTGKGEGRRGEIGGGEGGFGGGREEEGK